MGAQPPVQYLSQLQPGTHLVPDAPQRCPSCKGWGTADDPLSRDGREIRCPSCGGTGKILGWRVEADPPPPSKAGTGPAFTILMLLVFLGLIGAGLVYASANGSTAGVGAPASSAAAPVAQPAAKPAASPAPLIVASTPAPIVAAAANPWTGATCLRVLNTLADDARLDRQAAAKGPDAAHADWTPAAWAAHYQQVAAEWDGVGQLVAVDCSSAGGSPGVNGVPNCSTAIVWVLNDGAASHEADLARPGISASDRQWDESWLTFYRTLAADLQLGCGVG